jgi:hypothetical protein
MYNSADDIRGFLRCINVVHAAFLTFADIARIALPRRNGS